MNQKPFFSTFNLNKVVTAKQPTTKKQSNYSIATGHVHYENQNQALHAKYGLVYQKPIYSAKRFGSRTNMTDTEYQLCLLQAQYGNKFSQLATQQMITDIYSWARLKNHLNFQTQIDVNNTNLTVPSKLNFDYINFVKSFDNFSHISALDKHILGYEREAVVFVHDTDENVKLADLIDLGFLESQLIKSPNGQLYISKDMLIQLAKNPAFKQKMRFNTVDLDWTLTNYRAAMDYQGVSQLFHRCKSNKVKPIK